MSPRAALLVSAALATLAAAPASAATVTTFPDEGGPVVEPPTNGHAAGRAGARRTVLGDLSSRWAHVGGGLGVVADARGQEGSLAGRIVAGGGAYTIGLYGGGEASLTGSFVATPSLSFSGYFGAAIPVPVVHPMIGLRASVGLHGTQDPAHVGGGVAYVAPHVGAGVQAGVILRAFDGRPGLRLMTDVELEVRPGTAELLPSAFVTLAAVF